MTLHLALVSLAIVVMFIIFAAVTVLVIAEQTREREA